MVGDWRAASRARCGLLLGFGVIFFPLLAFLVERLARTPQGFGEEIRHPVWDFQTRFAFVEKFQGRAHNVDRHRHLGVALRVGQGGQAGQGPPQALRLKLVTGDRRVGRGRFKGGRKIDAGPEITAIDGLRNRHFNDTGDALIGALACVIPEAFDTVPALEAVLIVCLTDGP
jgi:hypothetical protein